MVADVSWIKLYIDMFDRRKIKKLRRLPAGNDLLLIWIMLLATAGKCNAGGMIFITESVPFTEEDLADELGFEVTTIKLALNALEELDMIAYSNEGFINIVGWEEHQNTDRLAEIREYNRLAKQKSRAKQKLLQSASEDVNDESMTSQPCHAIEEERDLEEDKEKDKEYSFNHSAKTDFNFSVDSTGFSTDLSTYEDTKRKILGGELGKGVVFLSDEQMDDLLDKLSLDEFNHYVGVVADCILKGKPFRKKTHYQAILDMATADRCIK
jgi:predicted phage replisome organizer